MIFVFGILWLVIAVLIALFIQGDILKGKLFYRVGLSLIILSFVCGVTMLIVIIAGG